MSLKSKLLYKSLLKLRDFVILLHPLGKKGHYFTKESAENGFFDKKDVRFEKY